MDAVGWGPVRVASVTWQPGPGSFAFTVVAKTTFTLMPGESPLDEEPEDIYSTDAHWDDDPSRSLVQAMDLVPGKARPEVLLIGSAYAPAQTAVRSLGVRLRVGDVDKLIRVHGDRWFSADGTLSEAQKFTRLPLSWERAAGGPETDNPVGICMGATARTDAWGRAPAPNLEQAGVTPVDRFRPIAPVGFGPIAPTWRPRASRVFVHGSQWDPERWHQRPLPGGFDYSFWNVAPADQHFSVLRGDEPIFLENLHRHHPQLSTRLAKIALRASIDWSGGSRSLPLAPDTMLIDTDRALVTLVFRGSTLLDHPQRAGRVEVEVVRAESAARLPAPPAEKAAPLLMVEQSLEPLAPAVETFTADATLTLVPSMRTVQKPALPFGDAPQGAGSAAGAVDITPSIAALAKQTHPLLGHAESATETLVAGFKSLAPALPFASGAPSHLAEILDHEQRAASPEAGQPLHHVDSADNAGDTLSLEPPRPPAAPRLKPGVPVAPSPQVPPLPFDAPGALRSFEAPRAEPWVQRLEPLVDVDSRTADPAVSEDPESNADTVLPPPMIGPLATPEMEKRAADRDRTALAIVASPVAELAPMIVVEAEPQPLPLDDFPLERCAALDASLTHRPEAADEILKKAQIDAATWGRIKAHYLTAVRAETKRGKTGLLRAYDEAYVQQLEKERGALREADFARIVVGAERGESGETLGGLGLPADAISRIQRQWIGKMAADPAVGAAVRREMANAREQ